MPRYLLKENANLPPHQSKTKLQFCFAFFVLFCFALVFAACLFLTSMAGCLWQGIGQSVPGLCLPLPSCLTVTGIERPCHSWSCLPQRSTAKDTSLIFVLIFHWHTPQMLCVSLYGDIHASEAPPHRPISREPGVWKSKWLFRPAGEACRRDREEDRHSEQPGEFLNMTGLSLPVMSLNTWRGVL